MQIIADLHLHSRYSRGTSKDIDIRNMEKYARMKGISVLGTGDFTFPAWIKELKENLTEDGSGILKTSTGFGFILSAEIANIYMQDGKSRRVHSLILAPDFGTAEQINEWLLTKGRLDYDGRPIFSFPCTELAENIMGISKDCMIIPAHIWTPWFSIFGSKSGFDSVEECFLDQAKHIHALETGLSSDPQMNWRLSSLDRFSLVSFSDSHSHWPWRMGREATVFNLKELTYTGIIHALKTKDGLSETIEVPPSFGKYHWDGHRNCGIHMTPKESNEAKNICPVCRKGLTIGVLHRVEELADRPDGFVPADARPFRSLIPLSELIGACMGIEQVFSRKVWEEYERLVGAFGSEFSVLLNASEKELKKTTRDVIADAILRNREGKIEVEPGYDGVYGTLVLGKAGKKETETPEETKEKIPKRARQSSLDSFV